MYHGFLLLNNPSERKYPIRGVDVSHYQGDIDWEILSGESIDFAYIKATEGSSHVDEKFLYNWQNAQKTKLKTGAYHFFSFDSPAEGQAVNFAKNVEPFAGMLPPVVDVEYYGNKKDNPPDKQYLSEQLKIYLDRMEQFYGSKPVIYTTEEVYDKYLKGVFDNYPLWIRNVITKPDVDREWTFWQFSNRKRLKGYSGEEQYIDINVYAGSEEDWASILK